jgi:hypothetical protein
MSRIQKKFQDKKAPKIEPAANKETPTIEKNSTSEFKINVLDASQVEETDDPIAKAWKKGERNGFSGLAGLKQEKAEGSPKKDVAMEFLTVPEVDPTVPFAVSETTLAGRISPPRFSAETFNNFENERPPQPLQDSKNLLGVPQDNKGDDDDPIARAWNKGEKTADLKNIEPENEQGTFSIMSGIKNNLALKKPLEKVEKEDPVKNTADQEEDDAIMKAWKSGKKTSFGKPSNKNISSPDPSSPRDNSSIEDKHQALVQAIKANLKVASESAMSTAKTGIDDASNPWNKPPSLISSFNPNPDSPGLSLPESPNKNSSNTGTIRPEDSENGPKVVFTRSEDLLQSAPPAQISKKIDLSKAEENGFVLVIPKDDSPNKDTPQSKDSLKPAIKITPAPEFYAQTPPTDPAKAPIKKKPILARSSTTQLLDPSLNQSSPASLLKAALKKPTSTPEDLNKEKKQEQVLALKVQALDLIVRYGDKKFEENPTAHKNFGNEIEKTLEGLSKEIYEDMEVIKIISEFRRLYRRRVEIEG